jgi:A/G-specific adenine glycosylase
VEGNGIKPREILRIVERKHIFTHVEWHMNGVYLEVQDQVGDYAWLSPDEITQTAALPTAFRQFWEELTDV